MKKRLLSAVLALAMALTMLPLSVFASPRPTDPGVSVTYHATKKANATYQGSFSAGYYSGRGTQTDPYVVATGTVLIGSKMYNSMGDAISWGSSFKLVGDDSSTITTDKTSITIDVNDHAFSGDITMSKGGTLNITDSQYKGTRKQGAGAISFNAGTTALSGTVTLTNVSVTSVSIATGGTGRVTLNNAITTGSVTLNGQAGYTNSSNTAVATNAAQTLAVNNTSTIGGNVSVKGKGSKVTLSTGTIAGFLTVEGAQTEVNASNRSTLTGNVTLTASSADADKSANAPKLVLDNSTITDTLTIGKGTQTRASDVTLSNNGRIVGATTLDNAAVKMTSSHMGELTLKKGSLTVGDKVNDGSTLGAVTLGADEAVDLKVSGGNITFTSITAGTKGVSKVDLEGATNHYGTLNLGSYKSTETAGNRGLVSGEIATATTLDRNWLYSKVTYQIDVQGGSVFAGADDFQVLVDNWNKQDTGSNITHLGGNGTPVAVTFTVDGNKILVVNAKPNAVIKLPAKVSTYDTTDWVDGNGTHRPSGYSYVVTGAAGLSSLGQNLDVTSITKVTASPSGIKATVTGGNIVLSGALELPGGSGNATTITLTVETNDGTKNTVLVSYLHDTKQTQFTSASYQGGGSGKQTVNIDGYTNQLTLQNGAKYGINGSALRKMVSVNIDGVNNGHVVVGRVNVPGYTTDAARMILIDAIQGTTNNKGTNFTAVNFSQSPAVLEGLNAAIAAMTDSQVTSWINSAQNTQFNADKKEGTVTGNFADQTKPYKGLDDVYVVAYLNMELTVYNKDTTPGTMTMTLTPYYRVEVRSDVGVDPVVVKAGAALTGMGEDWGSTSVKFNVETGFSGNNSYAHQNGTYVYPVTDDIGNLTFITLNGFGSYVINGIASKVQLVNKDGNGNDLTAVYFDTLQAAVDQAEDGGVITVLDTTYKLEPITLSGKARKFVVDTKGAGAVTVTNATGVVVDHTANTHEYTVQLTKDSAVTGNVVISAATVANGNVSLSTTRAAANSTVTITANPASGYSVTRITAKTNTGANVPVSSTGTNNKYTFTVPAGATSVTVTPEFAVAGQASIIVAPVANGSAVTNASGNVAQTNSTVTVTTTPNANYRTLGVSARTNTGASVAVTRSGNNLYYFTVPAGATSVTITPSFDLDTGMPFVDVLSTEFYLPYVQFVYKNGMMNGTEPTVFSGEQAITRGQLVAILWRQQGSPAAATYAGFVDVSASEYYASAITWAKNNKIVNGTSATTFEPDRAINRQEFATILYNFNNYLGKSTANQKNLNGYTDNGYVESWAKTAMQWCVGNGIISGDTPTTLSPYGTATRYQGATMLTRYCQNFLGMK